MSQFNFQKQNTILLHAGQEPDPVTGSRAVPIHQTTSYVFKNTEHAQNLFGLAEAGNIYTRIMNPTTDVFEQRVAQLEDGVAAVATASGMAAITYAILNIAHAGDEILADSNLYGGTYNLFVHTLPRYGITVKLVDGSNPENFRDAITENTKAIFGEIITNPSLNVFDVEKVANIAHENDIPLIIDNTFAPAFAKPIAWGADIVVHSATKWIGGHGTAIGGIVVDAGRFDWSRGKFPGFTEPDESYGGVRFADLGAPAFALKLRVQLLRDTGACISPHNAFLLLQGLETLHLRVERHNQNAIKVVEYLKDHPAVEWINFPGLEDHPSHELAKKYFSQGFGSVITFGIKGGSDAGRNLIDNVKLWSHVANVGDAKSLIIHPASTTHQQLREDELKSSGVTQELVRLAVGLESTSDILADLDQAISIATNEPRHLKSNEDDAIEWLLQSPFDRSEGLRPKVIAVAGLNETATTNIGKLQASGYQVISIDQIGENDIVDALVVGDYVVSADDITTLSEKQGKIVWSLDSASNDITENAQEANIQVVSNKDIYEETIRIRTNRQ